MSSKPIYLIVSYLLLVTGSIALKGYSWILVLANFMAGLLLVCSLFKLLELRGFVVESVNYDYDLSVKRWSCYAYIYPVLELILGIGYILNPFNLYLNLTTLILMSLMGVMQV